MNAMASTYDSINWTTTHPPHDLVVGDVGNNAPDAGRPPGNPLQHHAASRLDSPWPSNRRIAQSGLTQRDSQGADFNGRGTRLNRSAFAEEFTGNIGVSWIRAARPGIDRPGIPGTSGIGPRRTPPTPGPRQ